jgi:hypothetical protein
MLADELNAGNAASRLTVRVGQKLASIAQGETMPLELMMEGNLLNQFYVDYEALNNTLLLARSKGCRALCREVPGSQRPRDRRGYG